MYNNEETTKLISASILAADFANLGPDCELMIESGADCLHVDIMDNLFVPNISFGPPVVKSLQIYFATRRIEVFLDFHLMVQTPELWIDVLADIGASLVSFHVESFDGPDALHRAISTFRTLKECGIKTGLALSPGTDFDGLAMELCNIGRSGGVVSVLIDTLLVMTVIPGKGGQKLIPETLEKVKAARLLYSTGIDIQVDGGVNGETAQSCRESGANILVSGSYIFGVKGSERRKRICLLRGNINSQKQ